MKHRIALHDCDIVVDQQHMYNRHFPRKFFTSRILNKPTILGLPILPTDNFTVLQATKTIFYGYDGNKVTRTCLP